MRDPYRLTQATSLAHYLKRVDEIGQAIDDANLRDIAQVIGHMPDSRTSADTELEAIVKKAGPDRDQEFLELFYRIAMRDYWLVNDLPGITPTRPLQPLAN